MADPDDREASPPATDDASAPAGSRGARLPADQDDPDIEPFAEDEGQARRNGGEHGYGYE